MGQPSGFLARVTCKQCGRSALTESAPTGFAGIVNCGCCPEAHDHVAVSNGCPGAGTDHHAGQACPHPDPVACSVGAPEGEECPGGHCGLGVDGCQVCPGTALTIDIMSVGGAVAPVGG